MVRRGPQPSRWANALDETLSRTHVPDSKSDGGNPEPTPRTAASARSHRLHGQLCWIVAFSAFPQM